MTAADFWSRRKAAVEAETRAERAAEAARQQAVEEARLAERSDGELLAEAGLPEPEALESAEEVRAFLRSALPQRLKTRALRKLWRTNPVLANLDGLVDYDDDYTDAATVVENLQTVYRVGKGMLSGLDDVADAPAPDAAEEPDAVVAAALDDDPCAEPDRDAEPASVDIAEAAPAAVQADPPAPPAALAARRMRFRFDQTT